jgi:carboxyl-terminal processing protease
MKRYLLIGSLAFSLIGISFVTTNDRLFEISKNIELFVNTFKELNAGYVDEIDPGKLMKTGIDAMVESLDPYTNYISESQVESYRLNDDVKYKGIDAEVGMIDGSLTITEPHEGGEVAKAGVQAGDKITKINNLSTAGKSLEECESMLRGVGGTTVNLQLEKYNGKSESLVVNRVTSSKNNVPYYGFVDEGIGYITLTTFTADASKNISKGIKELKEENPSMEGIILDLRYNGGGLLREAINVSNIFVPKGEMIVSTRGKVAENNKEFETRGTPLDLETPLAVLINKKSASASEIVSGVIQDLDRGVIVGQRSFGKGLVQNTREIGYNSRVKLTTSKYYIPSGRCIQSVEYENGEPKDIEDSARSKFKTKAGRTVLDGGGVTPDIKLPAPITPDIIAKMEEDNLIFKFVNTIVAKTKDTMALEDIKYTDFAAFEKFVDSEDFNYVSTMRTELDTYEETVEEDQLYDDVKGGINQLRSQIESIEVGSMNTYKDQILVEINKELASRYYYEKGKTYSTLDQDTEIQACIDILRNTSKYNSILSK